MRDDGLGDTLDAMHETCRAMDYRARGQKRQEPVW